MSSSFFSSSARHGGGASKQLRRLQAEYEPAVVPSLIQSTPLEDCCLPPEMLTMLETLDAPSSTSFAGGHRNEETESEEGVDGLPETQEDVATRFKCGVVLPNDGDNKDEVPVMGLSCGVGESTVSGLWTASESRGSNVLVVGTGRGVAAADHVMNGATRAAHALSSAWDAFREVCQDQVVEPLARAEFLFGSDSEEEEEEEEGGGGRARCRGGGGGRRRTRRLSGESRRRPKKKKDVDEEENSLAISLSPLRLSDDERDKRREMYHDCRFETEVDLLQGSTDLVRTGKQGILIGGVDTSTPILDPRTLVPFKEKVRQDNDSVQFPSDEDDSNGAEEKATAASKKAWAVEVNGQTMDDAPLLGLQYVGNSLGSMDVAPGTDFWSGANSCPPGLDVPDYSKMPDLATAAAKAAADLAYENVGVCEDATEQEPLCNSDGISVLSSPSTTTRIPPPSRSGLEPVMQQPREVFVTRSRARSCFCDEYNTDKENFDFGTVGEVGSASASAARRDSASDYSVPGQSKLGLLPKRAHRTGSLIAQQERVVVVVDVDEGAEEDDDTAVTSIFSSLSEESHDYHLLQDEDETRKKKKGADDALEGVRDATVTKGSDDDRLHLEPPVAGGAGVCSPPKVRRVALSSSSSRDEQEASDSSDSSPPPPPPPLPPPMKAGMTRRKDEDTTTAAAAEVVQRALAIRRGTRFRHTFAVEEAKPFVGTPVTVRRREETDSAVEAVLERVSEGRARPRTALSEFIRKTSAGLRDNGGSSDSDNGACFQATGGCGEGKYRWQEAASSCNEI